jgi:oxygen-independent coproporphyrinogen III oxidase
MAGLYLHIPFCKQACHYCDFHFSTNLQQLPSLIDCMQVELALRKDYLKGAPIETIYLGGGTPSLVPIPLLEKLVDRVFSLFPGKKIEVTLEANPDDLHPNRLAAWKSMGIDRLSLGIQSFQEEILRAYNRAHNAEEAKKAIHLARSAGFEKFSIDLIYGYPHPNHALWEKDLDEALNLDPGHLSAYALTIEPKTALGNWASKGKFQPAEEEFVAQQFEWLLERSEQAGYKAYEISNFSKPGQEAIHNCNYWKGIPYLGIGPSAHSFDGTTRGYNPSNNPAYIKALSSQQVPLITETLEKEDRMNEEILTRLRTHWGLDTADFASRYSVDLLQVKEKSIDKLVGLGLLQTEGNILSLTRKGLLLADSISAELFLDSHDL